jgi:hypothetical protein
VEGNHERIISEEDFDEAIRLRESRRVYKKDSDFIFKKLVRNQEAIYEEAIAMIGELDSASSPVAAKTEAMEDNMWYISKLKSQLNTHINMCADGYISRETFREKSRPLRIR